MASINYAVREISIKVVYYGPGLSGKTTNLQVIHRKIPIDYRSDMVSLATETDRTLFFDFLPLDLGKIKGFSTKFQLYTVPGQVYYNATRKLVLRGVDGVVFVVDSGQDKMQENLESLQNLHDNLAEYGYPQGSVPVVLQYNKRDLPNAMPIDQLDKIINKYNYPWNEAVANQGKGIFESLKIIGKIVIDTLNKKYSRPSYGGAAPSNPAARPTQQPQQRPQQDPFLASSQQAPVRQQPQQQKQPSPQPVDDIFQAPPQKPAARPAPQQNQPAQSSDYMDYGALDLQPMAPQSAGIDIGYPETQQEAAPESERSDLDLEIEKYQREIEEKQLRLRSLQQASAGHQPQAQQHVHQAPVQQEQQFSVPQQENFDVYAPPDTEQVPQYPPQQTDEEYVAADEEDQPMYFTSVNTDQQRKKIKRPVVNPKNKPQNGFLKNLFNKDKPQ